MRIATGSTWKEPYPVELLSEVIASVSGQRNPLGLGLNVRVVAIVQVGNASSMSGDWAM